MWHQLKHILFTVSLLMLLAALMPPTARAQQVWFEDTFAQGLQKWELIRGRPEMWQIKNGWVEIDVEQYFTITEMVPKDEFWHIPPDVDEMVISFDLIPVAGVDRNFSFLFEDSNNWHELHFNTTFFNILHVIQGKAGLNEFVSFNMENDHLYQIKIFLKQEQLHVYINDEHITSLDDWSYDGGTGKIGLKLGAGAVIPARVLFDNVKVEAWYPPPHLITEHVDLQVYPFKQSDPYWADEIYDHADVWSTDAPPTIERWGCALTSAVMILRYHGITQLPDQQILVPSTLDHWLRTQPDGYIANGLVNWIALTRLAHIMSEQLDSSKLEFALKIGSQDYLEATLLTQLRYGQPTIAEVPGHFVVVDGFVTTENDHTFYIQDPWYDRWTLADHAPPLSLRTFTPSLTNLSYLLVSYDQQALTISPNTQQHPWQSHTEHITATNQDVSTQHALHLLAKPQPNVYALTATNLTDQPQTLTIITYDQTANATMHTHPVPPHATEQLSLDYQGTVSTLTTSRNFTSFEQFINDSWQVGFITETFTYLHFRRIVNYLEEYADEPTVLAQYRLLLQELLITYESTLAPQFIEYIQPHLQALPSTTT